MLRTDGGMVSNDLLMQFQADILDRPVVRPAVQETTALGAAYAAGLAVGFFKDIDDLRGRWSVDRTWKPQMDAARRAGIVRILEEGGHAVVRLAVTAGTTTQEENNASKFFGEFMGTLILILMGNGVVANVLLKRSKAEGTGWMVITTGWAFAVMTGVFTAIACGSPDAHLNPAVTLGVAVRTGDFSKVAPYRGWRKCWARWRARSGLAAFSAALGSYAGGRPETRLLLDVARHRQPRSQPADRSDRHVRPDSGGDRRWARKAVGTVPPGLGPYLVGMLVWAIGLSLGGTTGYAINPARDLGPRIMHAILPIPKKGTNNWRYAPVPVIGPLAGGAVAGLLVRVVGF